MSREQLRQLGVQPNHVARQVAARRWRTIGPRVVVLHRGWLMREAEFWVGVLHSGNGAALTAWTALEHYGLRRWLRPPAHIVVARGRSVAKLPQVVVHESRSFRPEGDRVRWRGLPIVRRPRAVLAAAAGERSADAATALVAAVVQQKVATAASIRAELGSAHQLRHRRHLLAQLDVISAGAESLAEVRVDGVLREAGLPAPRRQEVVWVGGRRTRTDCEIDLPDGSVLVLEVNGDDHDGLRVRAQDSLKDLAGAAHGRSTVRITPWMLLHRRAELVAALRAVRLKAEARLALEVDTGSSR